MKPRLENVTLIAVSGNKYGETLAALYKSAKEIDFKEIVYITDTNLVADGIRIVKVDPIKTWEEYNRVVIRELHHHFHTDYCLLVQHDGYVLNGDCWDDEFLKFDYIGSPWLYTDGKSVGNGGMSLRTKKLQSVVATDPTIEITAPEDEAICRLYRTYLEKKHGITYAPEKLAEKFGFELREPTIRTLGFHGYHHQPFKEHVVIRRKNSLGDVVMAEPVIEYYCRKGFQVVLDVPINYMNLFFQYPYYIKHIDELKPEVTPIKYIDLDMAYERKPKQLVLKSYFEAAGIIDGEIRNSKLFFPINDTNRLFKKYVVVHIDDTAMPHRNVRGVHWKSIVQYFNARGYDVFQIGKGHHEECGIFLNAPNEQMMMFVIAGASLFVGLDSGPSQIAVALGVPSVIMVGSVNLEYRYSDFAKIRVVQNKCERQHCYHELESIRGQDCFYDVEKPPCTDFSATQVMEKINELI